MSRRSPSIRNLSWPSLLLAVTIIGCRQFTPEKPTQTATKNTPRGSSRPDSMPSRSGGKDSGEGNLLLGNPTQAGRSNDNLLLDHGTYALSYNKSLGGPNWVAWHLDASDLGDVDRGKFAPDPDLPPDMQIRPTDYRGGGFDRGHVCPSGDRTASREENNTTFYMSNMLPQTASLNQHVWADLENYIREQIRDGNEAYIIAGGAGSAGRIKNKINVPQICWKVAVFLPEGSNDLRRINARTRVLAVGMPNVDDKRLETGDWQSYLTTVSKVESALKLAGLRNFDLLSELPAPVQKALESQTDKGQ